MSKDKESATEYPKAYFERLKEAEMECWVNPCRETADDLVWWANVFAAKVSQWALEERVNEKT